MPEHTFSLGFIGVGLMGKPMTLRLLNAGYTVNVWNRSPDKLAPVIAAGAVASPSISELVSKVEIVLLCLADTKTVQEIVEQQILPDPGLTKLIIDLSSIHPETTRELAEKLQRRGVNWVDAPVSGGVSGAEQGTLAIMAGGSNDAVAMTQKILTPLFQQFTHMGDVGCGQVTKICNQMLVSCNALVIAEMIALAEQAGVDAAKIPQALTGGFADSKPLQILGPEMATDTFEPIKWRVKTLLKDLTMAVDIATQLGTAVPMSGLAQQIMQLHGSQGHLEQDPATFIKLYRHR